MKILQSKLIGFGIAVFAGILCFSGISAPEISPKKPESEKYLSPSVLLTDKKNNKLYVAESTASQIAIIDLETGTLELESILLPQDPSGMALSADNETLYITAGIANGQVYVVNTKSRKILRTIKAGHSPCSPVIAKNRLYVCSQFENAVTIIDLARNRISDVIPVLREPVSSKLSLDGSKLLVANLLPNQASTESQVAASVSVIDVSASSLEKHILLPAGSHSLREIALSPDGRYAVVSHNIGRYWASVTQITRGWINTSALSIIDLKSMTPFNTVLLDDLDLGAANPWGVDFSDDGQILCVAHSGTHEISVIAWPGLLAKLDTTGQDVSTDLTYLAGLRKRIPIEGLGPRGITFAGSKVYAASFFSESVDIVNLEKGSEYETSSLPLGASKPMTLARLGEFYFNDATLSFQQWESCTSCHIDIRNDGLNWDLMNDGLGTPKNTKSLLYSHFTPPTTITGIRPNAETSVIAGFLHNHFVRFENDENLAIDEFLKAQQSLPSPWLEKGKLSKAARRGKALYESTGCIHCHGGEFLTDQKLHDVGTGTGNETGTRFDTPSLREIWRTGPYLYDGRAASMREVLTTYNQDDKHGVTSGLTEKELNDLETYIKSL